jgi:hypothetical protein
MHPCIVKWDTSQRGVDFPNVLMRGERAFFSTTNFTGNNSTLAKEKKVQFMKNVQSITLGGKSSVPDELDSGTWCHTAIAGRARQIHL